VIKLIFSINKKLVLNSAKIIFLVLTAKLFQIMEYRRSLTCLPKPYLLFVNLSNTPEYLFSLLSLPLGQEPPEKLSSEYFGQFAGSGVFSSGGAGLHNQNPEK